MKTSIAKRIFIAYHIEPSEKLLSVLSSIRKTLVNKNINWVPSENLHITLKFFGNVELAKIDSIRKVLLEICKSTHQFSLNINGIGTFPSSHKPSVLWLRLKDCGNTAKLADKINEEMSSVGFLKETKPFHAHLTIGRRKKEIDISKISLLTSEFKNEILQVLTIKEINLYESILSQQKPVYTILDSYQLL